MESDLKMAVWLLLTASFAAVFALINNNQHVLVQIIQYLILLNKGDGFEFFSMEKTSAGRILPFSDPIQTNQL